MLTLISWISKLSALYYCQDRRWYQDC